MPLSDEFLERYMSLPKDRRFLYRNYATWGYTAWRLSIRSLQRYIDFSNIEEMDFLWYSLNMNLASKIIYNYSPENYIYCENYISWRFGNDRVMSWINLEKFKYLIDETCQNLPRPLYEKLREHSVENMNHYIVDFISIFSSFDNYCCAMNYTNLLREAIEDSFFIEEFSLNNDDLSNKYFQALKSYLDNKLYG